MLSYFPAYQFPKVFKETKQNNDFSWTSFPYTIHLMPVYIKICIFPPSLAFQVETVEF